MAKPPEVIGSRMSSVTADHTISIATLDHAGSL